MGGGGEEGGGREGERVGGREGGREGRVERGREGRGKGGRRGWRKLGGHLDLVSSQVEPLQVVERGQVGETSKPEAGREGEERKGGREGG